MITQCTLNTYMIGTILLISLEDYVIQICVGDSKYISKHDFVRYILDL